MQCNLPVELLVTGYGDDIWPGYLLKGIGLWF